MEVLRGESRRDWLVGAYAGSDSWSWWVVVVWSIQLIVIVPDAAMNFTFPLAVYAGEFDEVSWVG